MLTYTESRADTACRLECLNEKPPVHEFVGPVKIVLMDIPTKVYKKKMWLAALIGMANLMIGATVVTVMYFVLALQTKLMPTLHIILCTFGYQLFIPMGILMVNHLQGPAAQMKPKDHRKHHVIIQVIGVLCAFAGSIIIYLQTDDEITFDYSITPHSIAGSVAFVLTFLSVITGPWIFCSTDRQDILDIFKGVHVFFAVPAFVASSVCFILGLFFSQKFKNWAPIIEMAFIPLIFCSLYTLIVIYKPTKKFFKPDVA